jgi:hypothetical protein
MRSPILHKLVGGAVVNEIKRMKHLVKITGRSEFIFLAEQQSTGGAIT